MKFVSPLFRGNLIYVVIPSALFLMGSNIWSYRNWVKIRVLDTRGLVLQDTEH